MDGQPGGQTDGMQRLMWPIPQGDPHDNISSSVVARCLSALLKIKISFASKKYAGKTARAEGFVPRNSSNSAKP